MRAISEFELVDIGIEHSQYFQGFGVATRCDFSAVGIGENPREALDDCLEQVAAQGFDTETIERGILAQYPDFLDAGKNESASVGAYLDANRERDNGDDSSGDDSSGDDCELYYHIGIRWSAANV